MEGLKFIHLILASRSSHVLQTYLIRPLNQTAQKRLFSLFNYAHLICWGPREISRDHYDWMRELKKSWNWLS